MAERARIPHIEVVDEQTAAVLRTKTAAERLAIAVGMARSARRMLTSHLAAEHPEWTADQVAAEVARRIASGGG